MSNVTIAVDTAKNVFRDRRLRGCRADPRAHTNRAAVALANKLARNAWAVWRHERVFDGDHALQLAAAA